MICFKFLTFILFSKIIKCGGFTKDEILTADALLGTINDDVDPCSDFYEYSCGRFTSTVSLSKPSITTLTIKQNEYLSELRTLLHTPKQLKEAEAIWKAKDFYTACMQTSSKEKVKLLRSLISNVFGGWPILEKHFWNDNNFNWLDVNQYLIKAGFKDVGFFDVFIDVTDKFQLILDVTSPALKIVLMKFNLTVLTEVDKYLHSLVDKVVKYLREGHEYQKEEVAYLVKFVLQYFSIIDNSDKENSSLQECTVEDLEIFFPDFEWNEIIKRLLRKGIQSNATVYVKGCETLKQIIDLTAMTDKRIIANYLLLNLFTSFFLNNEIFTDLKTRKNTFLPTDDSFLVQDLWISDNKVSYCVKHAAQITQAVRAMYLDYYFTSHHKLKLADLEYHIYSAHSDLHNEKLHKLNENSLQKNYSGHLILDYQYLDNIYQLLSSHSTDHIANVLALRRFKAGAMFSNYGKSIDQKHKHFSEMMDNTEIHYSGSVIEPAEIPLYLMKGLTYSTERCQSLNYGMYGFKVAQFLLVNNGIECASLYNTTIKTCLQKQLEQFVLRYPENMFAGNIKDVILNDIMRDTVSLKIAYSAYNNYWVKENKWDNGNLPGLNRTSRQLFWLGYASMHCHDYDEEILVLLKNIYPQKFRVINVLQNMPQFAEDYDCPVNSFVQPEGKCGFD